MDNSDLKQIQFQIDLLKEKMETSKTSNSDNITIQVLDRFIQFVEQQRKENIETDLKLAELKYKHDMELKQKLAKVFKDSKVFELLIEKWYPEQHRVAAATKESDFKNPDEKYKQNSTDNNYYDSLKIFFANHSEQIKSKVTPKTFDLLKNIFDSLTASDLETRLKHFSDHIISTSPTVAIDTTALVHYYDNELDADEKKLIRILFKLP